MIIFSVSRDAIFNSRNPNRGLKTPLKARFNELYKHYIFVVENCFLDVQRSC